MLFQKRFYPIIGWIGVLAAAAMQLTSQPSQQRNAKRVLAITLKILALKNTSKNLTFLPLFYATFQ